MCGIEVRVNAGEITRIRANQNDVWSKGYLCPKGATLGRLHHDPDRLRTPLVRDANGVLQPASWDDAFARAQDILHGIIARHGRSALAVRTGNAAGRSTSLSRYIAAFSGLAKIARYGSSTVDQQPKNASCNLMYGNAWKIAVPDIARTDYFVVMGANSAESMGNILAFPDVLGEIGRIRERGGRTVVIDPVRTRTAKMADEWVPIVPGTDALFLLAMCNVLFANGLVRLGRLAVHVNGVDVVRSICAEFTPESVEAVCGVPAVTTRRIAHDIASAHAAAVYGRIGLCTQEFGTLSSWLTDVVAILTGHFDEPGTLMFANPVAPFMDILPSRPFTVGTTHTRVRNAPEVIGEVPAACLAEEIDTPGEGQIKGLITMGCNPVISAPNSARLDAALPLLEGMISVDLYVNATTRHADVIFPATSAFEQPYSDIWSWIFALRSGIKHHDALFESPIDWVPEWQVLLRLGALINGSPNDEIDITELDDAFFSNLCTYAGIDPTPILKLAPTPGPERIIDWAIRLGPWGDRYGERPNGLTMAKVRDAPQGLDFGPAISRLPEMLTTASGKIELAPEFILSDLPRLRSLLTRQQPSIVLVSRRHARSLNSWMHNLLPLVKGKPRCTLHMHPDDARRLGLADATMATVANTTGSVDVPIEITEDIRQGVVSLPHGWSQNHNGMQMEVSRQYAGVLNNFLPPGDLLDEISGNAVLNGIPVTVSACPAAQPSPDSADSAASFGGAFLRGAPS